MIFVFQFLIGWLQTKQKGKGSLHTCFVFQFLIGWLQTSHDLIRRVKNVRGFNSLQVGYKPSTESVSKAYASVSIPYRLATNEVIKMKLYVAKKEFQFLIGWLQTYNLFAVSLSLLYSFNSLQVGYKRRYEMFRIWDKVQFQFLIGWLQTSIAISISMSSSCFNSLQVGYKPYPA